MEEILYQPGMVLKTLVNNRLNYQKHITNKGLKQKYLPKLLQQPRFHWNSRGPISLPKRFFRLGAQGLVWGRELIWPESIVSPRKKGLIIQVHWPKKLQGAWDVFFSWGVWMF